jgi:hypothetical protein
MVLFRRPFPLKISNALGFIGRGNVLGFNRDPESVDEAITTSKGMSVHRFWIATMD